MNNPKTIVHVTPQYPPYLGGLPIVVESIAQEQLQQGHRVRVFATNINAEGSRSGKQPNGLDVYYLKSYVLFNAIITPWLFFKLLSLPKNTIVHIHVGPSFTHDVVWLASHFTKWNYIAHIHGELRESDGLMSRLLPLYKNLFYKRVLKKASHLITPTRDYVTLTAEAYGIHAARFSVIPNPVDPGFFGVKNHEQNKATMENPAVVRLVYSGRLAVEKNVPILIHALHVLLGDSTTDYKLSIIGDGPQADTVRNLVSQLKLENSVQFHGRLDRDKVKNIYRNCNILILPSQNESWGLSLLEAMAANIPVVASDIPGIREIISNKVNGMLVPQSPEGIALAVQQLVKDRDLYEKLQINGRATAEKFILSKIVRQIETVYEKYF